MRIKPILFISPLPPPQGGIATWTKIMLEIGLPQEFLILLVNTNIRGKRHIADHVFFSWTEILRNIRILSSLLFHLITKRPKLIHVNCSLSSIGIYRDLLCVCLAKFFQIPTISHYHGHVPDFKGHRFYGLSHVGLQLLIKMSHVNIVENNASFKEVEQLQKKEIRQTVLLPNFIQETIFNYQVTKTNLHARPRALFAGGITYAKGCVDILSIATQMPHIDFYLFGKMHQEIASLFMHHPTNIILHDVIQHDALLNEMCASDFLLFPSHTEGFPFTVLEAMTVGLPVIATRVGAIPEMIDEELGGFLLIPQDVSGLINAISKFISDPVLKLKMGQYNKQKSFNHYRCSVVTKKLLTIYHQLIGS